MYRSLEGQTVLVTGGARGIGRAIVERFCEEGSRVLAVDKSFDRPSVLPSRVEEIFLDITSQKGIREDLAHRNIDILVNNAAITIGDNHMAITRTNIDGTRYVTDAVLPRMQQRKSGSIIFITSIHSKTPFPGDKDYGASKHWAYGFMRALALENAQYGIRVNAVAPGAIQNAGTNHDKKEIKKASKTIPMRRFGSPFEIANVVAFLASDEASYITGTDILVDGGLLIQNPFRLV